MKKQILNIGKALNKTEQKEVSGGFPGLPIFGDECSSFNICDPMATFPDGENPVYCDVSEVCTDLGTGYVCVCRSSLNNY